MLKKVNAFINRKTGMRYWYSVKFHYKLKRTGPVVFDFTRQIGLMHQCDVLDGRTLKKVLAPLHKNENLKRHLNNGTLWAEVRCYLGRFKRSDTNRREAEKAVKQ